MEITYRLNDPVSGLILADAYMRWALEAAEEVASADEFAHILAQAGLSQFIDNYPPDNVDPPYLGVTFGAYARLNAALLTHYGLTGKSIVRRIGRITVHKAVNHQSKLFNLETVLAAKSMPSDTQIKLGLSAMVTGYFLLVAFII